MCLSYVFVYCKLCECLFKFHDVKCHLVVCGLILICLFVIYTVNVHVIFNVLK